MINTHRDPQTVTRSDQRRPILILDGAESVQGRALHLVSALQFCLDWLPRVDARMIDVTSDDVELALTVFQWEHGINISISGPKEGTPLVGADLYAAACFRSGSHLRLDEAHRFGVPAFVAIQYPDTEWCCASVLLRRPAAFDPCVFAAELGSIIRPWL